MHSRKVWNTPSILSLNLTNLHSPIHQNIKEKIVASTEQDTVHIFRTLRNTARVFKNKVSMEVVALERRPGGAKFEDLRELVSGARGRVVYENGDPDVSRPPSILRLNYITY